MRKLEDFISIESSILGLYKRLWCLEDRSFSLEKYEEIISYIKISMEVEMHFLEKWFLSKSEVLEVFRHLNIDSNLFSFRKIGEYGVRYFEINDPLYMRKYGEDQNLGIYDYSTLFQNTSHSPIVRRSFYKILSFYLNQPGSEKFLFSDFSLDALLKWRDTGETVNRETIQQFLNLSGGMNNLLLSSIMRELCHINDPFYKEFLLKMKYILSYVNPVTERYMIENRFGQMPLSIKDFSFLKQEREIEVLCFSYIINTVGHLIQESDSFPNIEIVLKEILLELEVYGKYISMADLEAIPSLLEISAIHFSDSKDVEYIVTTLKEKVRELTDKKKQRGYGKKV